MAGGRLNSEGTLRVPVVVDSFPANTHMILRYAVCVCVTGHGAVQASTFEARKNKKSLGIVEILQFIEVTGRWVAGIVFLGENRLTLPEGLLRSRPVPECYGSVFIGSMLWVTLQSADLWVAGKPFRVTPITDGRNLST